MVRIKTLVVRGGWDGHHPVESTELFVPFLRDNGYEVRIEESPAVYMRIRKSSRTEWLRPGA